MKLKLGIVLGLFLIIAACKKEEVAISTGQQPEIAVNVDIPAKQEVDGNLGTNTNENPLPNSLLAEYNLYEDVDDLLEHWNSEPIQTNWEESDVHEAIRVDSNISRTHSSATITWTDKMPTDERWVFVNTALESNEKTAIDRPVPLCPYEDCSTAIPAVVAQYQALANQLCQDLYTCVACCSGGYILYACIVIRHQCGIIPLPHSEEY